MRTFLFFASLATASPLLLVAGPARADISDSEKQAARDLYREGVELQRGQRFADALERFQKAQRVIFAHTHLLHIAQCQVALGHLVEGAEAYRQALRAPTGDNPAFNQARDQADDELRILEPRIPRLKIDVTPRDAANLSVQIDGQAVNTALLDVSMQVNPGARRVTVTAPGFSNDAKTVLIQEREQKTITLVIRQVAVVYTPPQPDTNPAPPPPAPPPYYGRTVEPYTPPAPVRPTFAERSFLFGVRGGVDIAGGGFMTRNNTDGTTTTANIGDIANLGGSFAVEAGLRLSRFYLGAFYEFSSFGKGTQFGELATTGENFQSEALPTQNVTGTLDSHFVGIDLGWISNPQLVGLYADIGIGYRIMPHTLQVQDSLNASNSVSVTETFSSLEVEFALGVYVRAGSWLRLVPRITLGIGAFDNVNVDCTQSGSLPNFSCSKYQTGSQSLSGSPTHTFVGLGVTAFYDAEMH